MKICKKPQINNNWQIPVTVTYATYVEQKVQWILCINHVGALRSKHTQKPKNQ